MNTKYLLGALLLVGASAYAEIGREGGCPVTCPPGEIYIGGHVGYGYAGFNTNATLYSSQRYDNAGKYKLGGEGALGGGSIGMNYRGDGWYTGLEIRATAMGAHAHAHVYDFVGGASSGYDRTVRCNGIYDISVTGGMIFRNLVRAYLRVGPAIGSFKISQEGGTGTGSLRKTRCGPLFGVGVKLLCTNEFDVGLEYSFATFGKLKKDMYADGGQTAEFRSHTVNVRPSSVSMIMLTASYKFCFGR